MTPRSIMEMPMFNAVGWVVVTGFALYGLSRFIEEHVVKDKASCA